MKIEKDMWEIKNDIWIAPTQVRNVTISLQTPSTCMYWTKFSRGIHIFGITIIWKTNFNLTCFHSFSISYLLSFGYLFFFLLFPSNTWNFQLADHVTWPKCQLRLRKRWIKILTSKKKGGKERQKARAPKPNDGRLGLAMEKGCGKGMEMQRPKLTTGTRACI